MIKTDNIQWKIVRFEELTTSQLYEILYLRNKIFIVEQQDIYLDLDFADQKAHHMMAVSNDEIVAYARILLPDNGDEYAKFGRVLVVKNHRKTGLGKELMNQILLFLQNESFVKISAQLYLKEFYKEFGFVAQGKIYLDGSIEHIDMILKKDI